MRTAFRSLLLLAVFAMPAQAQVCKKSPPPFLADLFPAKVRSLPIEFSTAPGGGCMALYRPEDQAARASAPWASVTMDVSPIPSVGETAADVQAYFGTQEETQLFAVNGWPVAFTVSAVGDQFVTVRGAVRIKILIKNGDHGDASRALAVSFMENILPNVPCG